MVERPHLRRRVKSWGGVSEEITEEEGSVDGWLDTSTVEEAD
jgi:hypothetical protein